MKPFPHTYRASAVGAAEGVIAASSQGLPTLPTDAPAEFDGPGDQWSPETLLVAVVADCFVLTFRAFARYSNLPWRELVCNAEGVLDRVDGVTRFTEMRIDAHLSLAEDGDEQKARRVLDKAERQCLITNSLVASTTLKYKVI